MDSYLNAGLILLIITMGVISYGNCLSMDYYMLSCPFAEAMVRSAVSRALVKDPTLAAALLRMHFHDCFIQGCDGSVLIDSTEDNRAEKDSPANLSLRGFEVIDEAKRLLEDSCPATVSCADILAMAARDAVFFAGGPMYAIEKGRMDGRRSRIEDTINLPQPNFNASALITIFGKHGLNAQDMVALSGGHTLGAARCITFKDRLSHEVMEPSFAGALARKCAAGDGTPVAFDSTPEFFDGNYYSAIRASNGLLFSDQTLFRNPITRGLVNAYSFNPVLFFSDFQRAVLKMGLLRSQDADHQAEVRLHCRRIN